ncbi:hypothetical protein HGRIS_004374 [Hohenbuehelia grisea]|uniref:Macrofage activating glycoprotein n=1 Tax=Hohenbuehelia grisea TaxID=104357 RepID=A0ABR3JBQ6_9AGAR
MAPVALSAFIAASAASLVAAQVGTFPATPLASKRFAYPSGLPYKADTENLVRGIQTGYNICNSTTESQDSLCQTGFVNSVDDFCLWGAPKPNSIVGDTEGEAVAWCTKPGRGTRLIPEGALKGVQFMRTPDYVQVVGYIDQAMINIQHGDYGGEMDPHGADLRGNPLGGLVYSNSWSGSNTSFTQVIEWHNFMGSDQFCFKACDPSKTNAAHFCEHTLDRIGCAFNAPHAAQTGVFESCEGDNQDFPGVYTTNGAVVTYKQPPEELGAITTMPYTARIPASSNCVKYTSSELFVALASATPNAGAVTTSASSASSSATGSSASRSGTSSGTAAGAASTSNDAGVVVMSGFVSVLGVLFSAIFLS